MPSPPPSKRRRKAEPPPRWCWAAPAMSTQGAVSPPPRPGIPLARPPSARLGPLAPRKQCFSLRTCSSASAELTFECSLVVAVIAVRALYAGTLATIWTTAPSLSQRPSVQLAALCLLATLTIAARCYASSNATHPLVQFSPTPSSLSPIDNSNARPHSSTLVLSRLFSPRPVQSDTSVILINSKKLLHNQNSNKTNTPTIRFRTKRELYANSKFYNRILADYSKRTAATAATKIQHDFKKANVLVSSETTDNSVGDNTSADRVNYTKVNTSSSEAEHQNDSSFIEQDAPAAHSEGTERPMPPVHDHGNASCKLPPFSHYPFLFCELL